MNEPRKSRKSYLALETLSAMNAYTITIKTDAYIALGEVQIANGQVGALDVYREVAT